MVPSDLVCIGPRPVTIRNSTLRFRHVSLEYGNSGWGASCDAKIEGSWTDWKEQRGTHR